MICSDHLAHERSKAKFDVEAMKIVWAGSPHEFLVSDRMAHLVASDPRFRRENRAVLSRKELFTKALRKAAHSWKRINELGLSDEEASWLWFYVDELTFAYIHWGMFVPAIKGSGTEEQQNKWLPLATTMRIIGSYAQTELGHGSNVQGIETTATFDPTTDEFIIHSPTLTSSKLVVWRIGEDCNSRCCLCPGYYSRRPRSWSQWLHCPNSKFG